MKIIHESAKEVGLVLSSKEWEYFRLLHLYFAYSQREDVQKVAESHALIRNLHEKYLDMCTGFTSVDWSYPSGEANVKWRKELL